MKPGGQSKPHTPVAGWHVAPLAHWHSCRQPAPQLPSGHSLEQSMPTYPALHSHTPIWKVKMAVNYRCMHLTLKLVHRNNHNVHQRYYQICSFKIVYLWVASGCRSSLALTLVAAVWSPREGGTRHVTLGPEASWVTLAEPEHSVAAHVRTRHGTPTVTLRAIVAWRGNQ